MDTKLTPVERASKVVDQIAAKQRDLLQTASEIEVSRQAVSLEAALGDRGAKSRLATLSRDAAAHQLELENLNGAFQLACERLRYEQIKQQREVARDQAKRRLELAGELRALGPMLDAGKVGIEALEKIGAEINAAGSPTPSCHQIRVFGDVARRSALVGTRAARHFEPVPPTSRTTYERLCSGWANTVEIAARTVLEQAAA